MRVLADTNVLFDFLSRRQPFEHEAKLLLFGCAMGDFELWLSSPQLTDLHFLLTHGDSHMSAQAACATLQGLRRFVRVASLTEEDVDAALASGWRDFEDACVYQVARHLKCDYLVSRNCRDFPRTSMPAVSPGEFLEQLESDCGITYAEVPF